MNKIFIGVILLAMLFSGCAEEKAERLKDYKIELNSYSVDFESGIKLEVFSEKGLEKTRFEIVDERKKIKCFDYFDLKKGKNDVFIDCVNFDKKLLLEITPSDGKTKEFEIKVKPKERITLRKGFKYYFAYESVDYKVNMDYEVFVLDENQEFFKVMINTLENKRSKFNLLLIDKNSFEVYSSMPKDTCFEAYKSALKKRFEAQEIDLVFPFVFFYYQNNRDFRLNEFFAEKSYFNEKLKLEVKLGEKALIKGIEAYEAKHILNNKQIGTYYIQSESPYILIYYKSDNIVFEFKGETEEELNCLAAE